MPLWISGLDSMGDKVPFMFITDGLSLGGLGAPRVDSPIAAAMMEFVPWSIDGGNNMGPVAELPGMVSFILLCDKKVGFVFTHVFY